MIKKALTIVLLILLSACSKVTEVDNSIETKEYVEPINDVFIFDQIDNESRSLLKYANGNKEFENYQFKMLKQDTYLRNLLDFNNNTINLKDINTYLLCVISTDCKHCKQMIKDHLETMRISNVKPILYFNVGDKKDILDFFNEIQVDISSDLIIIPHDEMMEKYIKEELHLESYPSLICFYDGKVSFDEYGDIDNEQFETLYDIGFVNRLEYVKNDNIEWSNIIKSARSIEDVKGSLSKENYEKLKAIDNDNSTIDYSLKLMGSRLNYDLISANKDSMFVSEIDDYSIYKDKDVVIIYTYFANEEETDKVRFINSLIASNKEVEYIVVLIEGMDSSSNYYRQMGVKFNCKATSVLGYTPDDFYRLGVSKYPTAFFVEKSTFTGAYSNIDSVNNFNKAIKLFFGDECIAQKSNN